MTEFVKQLLVRLAAYVPAVDSKLWNWSLAMAAICWLGAVLYKNADNFDVTEIKALLEWAIGFIFAVWLREKTVTPVKKSDAELLKDVKEQVKNSEGGAETPTTVVIFPKRR